MDVDKPMLRSFLCLLLCSMVTKGMHFNGGTIAWEPITPNINSSVVPLTITQSYSWTYPAIACAQNVPITTSGRSSQNSNLTCITDCITDGGYKTKPINILTDCQTVSSSLGLMTSQRSVNINLTAGAHFYLAHIGAAWAPLGSPAKSGLEWSIVTFIDLRLRPDGLINTPPVASVVSPQYAIVNRTTQITIPVSDANTGDTVRCRWSTYTPGSRRRRKIDEESISHYDRSQIYRKASTQKESVLSRKKRGKCKGCKSTCAKDSLCCCSACAGTTCTGSKCTTSGGCPAATTTLETPGTVAATSSYPTRQAIDECGGICYPSSTPNGTTLAGCTISFTGLIPDTWYAISIQVEDFFNSTTTTPMSSTPVQLLIYVMEQPTCGLAPVILPLTRCFDAQVNVSISFNISAMTRCNPNISDIDTIMTINTIPGMNMSDPIDSLTNASVSYATVTWKPQLSQLGPQSICFIAYTE